MPEWFMRGMLQKIPSIQARETIMALQVAAAAGPKTKPAEYGKLLRSLQSEIRKGRPQPSIKAPIEQVAAEFGIEVE